MYPIYTIYAIAGSGCAGIDGAVVTVEGGRLGSIPILAVINCLSSSIIVLDSSGVNYNKLAIFFHFFLLISCDA